MRKNDNINIMKEIVNYVEEHKDEFPSNERDDTDIDYIANRKDDSVYNTDIPSIEPLVWKDNNQENPSQTHLLNDIPLNFSHSRNSFIAENINSSLKGLTAYDLQILKTQNNYIQANELTNYILNETYQIFIMIYRDSFAYNIPLLSTYITSNVSEALDPSSKLANDIFTVIYTFVSSGAGFNPNKNKENELDRTTNYLANIIYQLDSFVIGAVASAVDIAANYYYDGIPNDDNGKKVNLIDIKTKLRDQVMVTFGGRVSEAIEYVMENSYTTLYFVYQDALNSISIPKPKNNK